MRRALPVALCVLVLLIGGCRSNSKKQDTSLNVTPDAGATIATPAPTSTPSPSETETPTPTPTPEPEPEPVPADPVRVKIPKLKVDAKIVPVGVNYAGEMDSPKNAWDVAWYAPGYKPFEQGNAVLAGHVDYINVGPAVFFNVKTMVKGDRITIASADGKEYEFEVTETQQCKAEQCPIERIFGPNPNRGITLITCIGNFNRRTLEYDARFVVYAEAVKPAE
jgi:sortase (surface protein transpeptidase)